MEYTAVWGSETGAQYMRLEKLKGGVCQRISFNTPFGYSPHTNSYTVETISTKIIIIVTR